MLPATTRECYITGLSALSVPYDGKLADWRLGSAFSGRKPLPITGVNMPSTKHLWGVSDTNDYAHYFTRVGLPVIGPLYIATPARAVADLLYKLIHHNQDPTFLYVDQIPMTEDLYARLGAMMQVLMDQMPTPRLRQWIQHQPRLTQWIQTA